MIDPKPRRKRRVLKIVLGTIALLLVAVIGVVAFVLSHLETPAVKTRLQALVKSAAGIELDYEEAHAAITSGLHLRDIRIKTGGSLRSVAPELAHIGSLDVTWGIGRLMSASVDGVVVKDVDVTIVLDDDGRSSFDFEPPEVTKKVAKKVVEKRSKSIAALLKTAVPLHGAHVDPIHVVVMKTHEAKPYDRMELKGLEIAATHDGDKTTISLGEKAKPLTLDVTDKGPLFELVLTPSLFLEAVVHDEEIELALDVHAGPQKLVPGLDHVIALAAHLLAEPSKSQLSISVTNANLADDAMSLVAEVALPDDDDDGKVSHPPLLRSAKGKIDAQKLLALVPRSLVPPAVGKELPHLKSGVIDLDAEKIELASMPRVLDGGHIALAGDLEDVHATLPMAQLSLPHLKLDVRSGADRKIDATIDGKLESLRYEQGKTKASVTDARLEVRGKGIDLDPQHRAGSLDVSLHASAIDAHAGGADIALSGTALEVKGAIPSAPPYGGTIVLDIDRVSVVQGKKHLANDALVAHLRLDGVQPDGKHAQVKGDLKLGALALDLAASKNNDVLDYDVTANAPTLALLSPIVSGVDVPWANVGLAMKSKGHVDTHGRLPFIKHDTHLELDHFSLHGPAGTIAAKAIALDVASEGTTKLHDGTLAVGFTMLRRDNTTFGDGKINGSVKIDAEAPKVALVLKSEGPGAPGINVRADLGFDRKGRRLSFDLALHLSHLGVIAPLAGKLGKQIDLGKLELDMAGKGEMAGLVDELTLDGTVKLAKDPLLAVGNAKLAAHVSAIDWHLGDQALTSPKIGWDGELRASHDKRTLSGDISIEDLRAAFGMTKLGINHIGDHLQVAVNGDPRKLDLDLSDTVKVRGVSQELSGSYALQDVQLDVHATGSKDGVIRVPLFRFSNRAAGTTLDLTGGLDLSEDRRSLAMRGSLKQDLGKLWQDKTLFRGTGLVETDVALLSGDLRRFDAKTSLRMQNVTVELPRQKIKITNVDGEIPVAAELMNDANGLHLVHLSHDNSYSELRFADQHPMMSQHSFLTISSIETPWVSIAPFAGNLAIQDNILSISQLEMGVRGGRVTGRCEVQLEGQDSKAELNLRASNVHSSRGEPFDGNTALEVSVRQRSIDGRAEVLRIGRRHLLDMLDVVDPTRTDPSINKVRRVLAIAYPDHLRLEFKRGFASAKVDFGGLGRLIKLDEIKGIPMGPIIDRALGPDMKDEGK